jgi:hypothetical protein
MPAARLVGLITGLSEFWGPHEENTARLLEAYAYQLEWGWADRTIDPDSPEAKQARAEARKVKAPPHPIIPPAAYRPKTFADERMQEYVEELKKYLPEPEAVDPFEQLALWKAQHSLVSQPVRTNAG